VWADQAIYTSIVSQGRGGYHLISRSKAIVEEEAQAISRWSPSHGSLLQDSHNHVSVNFFPLPTRRFALTRTCEGPPEYSGRGGRQLYSHILVIDEDALKAIDGQPFAIYRNALAMGNLLFQPSPPRQLDRVQFPGYAPRQTPEQWLARAGELGLPPLEPLINRLMAGRAVRFGYSGDRAVLAECLLGALPKDALRQISFATSLQPSTVRPFILSLVGPDKRA
jgi:hypothetical protein